MFFPNLTFMLEALFNDEGKISILNTYTETVKFLKLSLNVWLDLYFYLLLFK